jgi:hypothetical protein
LSDASTTPGREEFISRTVLLSECNTSTLPNIVDKIKITSKNYAQIFMRDYFNWIYWLQNVIHI